jgi:D-glycero-D-manno-heptose 1,7-bisphosphate phosphatase
MQAPKLVILGRDGILNVFRTDHVKGPEEWEPIPGALEAVARLNHAGWHVVVATNQSGIGRGLIEMAALNEMHQKMNKLLAKLGGRIDAVFFCPHSPDAGCDCRKPLPGLFRQIGERYGVSMKNAPAVGDSLRDLQASVAAGCEPHLVRTGKSARLDEAALDKILQTVPGTRVHDDLAAFATFLLSRERDDRKARGEAASATDDDSDYGKKKP